MHKRVHVESVTTYELCMPTLLSVIVKCALISSALYYLFVIRNVELMYAAGDQFLGL